MKETDGRGRVITTRIRTDVRDRQRQFEELGGQFEEGHLTDVQLLREIAKTCGPSRL